MISFWGRFVRHLPRSLLVACYSQVVVEVLNRRSTWSMKTISAADVLEEYMR